MKHPWIVNGTQMNQHEMAAFGARAHSWLRGFESSEPERFPSPPWLAFSWLTTLSLGSLGLQFAEDMLVCKV